MISCVSHLVISLPHIQIISLHASHLHFRFTFHLFLKHFIQIIPFPTYSFTFDITCMHVFHLNHTITCIFHLHANYILT